MAATQIKSELLEIEGLSNLTWFQSSATAKRGFCKICGSQLFWTEVGSNKTIRDGGNNSWHNGAEDGPTTLLKGEGRLLRTPQFKECKSVNSLNGG